MRTHAVQQHRSIVIEGMDLYLSSSCNGTRLKIVRQNTRRRKRPRACPSIDGYNGIRAGEAIHCGPMRVQVQIASLKVDALVDTGTDYDAVDTDLSARMRTSPDHLQAFVSRREVPPMSVGGLTVEMKQSTMPEFEWKLTSRGAEVWGGELRDRAQNWTFNEFRRLGDPLIFGMPFLRAFNGFAMED